jgi:hypothetical protein
MSRGSDVPPLCESADRYSASRHRREAAAALLSVARAEGDQPKGRHLRAVRPAGHATVYRNSILRVAFTRGEIQLAARGADLTLDITAKHFDVAGYLRLEHACGKLPRVEAQRLIAALLAFLASTTDTSEMADRPDPLTMPDNPTLAGIATAESHVDPSAVHINEDGSRDVGLMQINERNFGWLGLTPQTALDPCQSIRAAAQLLQSYSRYNTGSPVAGFSNGYVQRVTAAVAQARTRAVTPRTTLSGQIASFTLEESR